MATTNDNPGVIALPPLLFAGALAAGLAAQRALGLPRSRLPATPRKTLAGALMVGGIGLAVAAALRFRAAGTNIPPTLPATAVVRDGVYRVSRNPMYAGMTMLYAGLSFLADSPLALGLLAPLLAVVRTGVIAREERYMEAKFGAEYRAYRDSVPRWL